VRERLGGHLANPPQRHCPSPHVWWHHRNGAEGATTREIPPLCTQISKRELEPSKGDERQALLSREHFPGETNASNNNLKLT